MMADLGGPLSGMSPWAHAQNANWVTRPCLYALKCHFTISLSQ